MDAIICDISALQYWRTPPIVRLLAAAPEDDDLLSSVVSPEQLQRVREGCARLPLARACASSPGRWRRAGEAAHAVRACAGALAPSVGDVVDVLVTRREQSRRATVLRPRLWSAGVPSSELRCVADGVLVVSPAFGLLQLARRAGLVRTVLLASELCGSFAVYETPDCVREVLQELAGKRRLPRIGGWAPCLDADGRVSDLWSRRPLCTPGDLRRIAEESESSGGRARLLEAAGLVVPGAASPLEVQTGVLLGFSRRRGGEGHAGFSHNRRIALTPEARAVAGRASCYCDLYWDEGVDLECQSRLVHDAAASYLSDAGRTAALELMGVRVLPVTYGQLTSGRSLESVSRALAEMRGVPWREPTERQRGAGRRLRQETLVDWRALPLV